MTLKITTDNISSTALQTLGGGVKISSLTYPNSATAADPAGSETITVNGSGFNTGAKVYIDTTLCTTTYVSSTSLTFVSPAKSIANYHLFVYNTDGSNGMYPAGMVYSSLPVWVTNAGSIAAAGQNVAFSQSVSSTGDGTITYSVTSGSLPTGLSLNSSTGAITGTPTATGTSNFTITATDSQNQKSSRSFSITVSNVPSTMDYLVVAGGGAGAYYGAGGGAGGLLTASGVSITAGVTYTITVGGGAATVSAALSNSGSNSSISGSGFTTVTTVGGGGGSQNGLSTAGANGGSGGGGGVPMSGGKGVYPGSSYLSQARQGYDGGLGGGGVSGNYHGGGGGGAGGVGADGGAGAGGVGGDGGLGYQSSITGTALYYAGGGGGSGFSGTQGVGGSGVGGSGNSSTVGGDGAVYTGSGGGGGGYSGGILAGGNGGSGVVIIRYPDTYALASSTTGSPTVTNPTGYRVYKFTGSGSITF